MASTTPGSHPDKKACSKCGESKPLEEFSRQPRGRYGRRASCRACERAYHTIYLRENPEKRRAFAEAQRPKHAEYLRRFREEHPMVTRRQSGTQRARQFGCTYIEGVDALAVLELNDGACGICGRDVDPFDFDVDHIVPLSKGGFHNYANCQPAHNSCNVAKFDKIPEAA